MRRFFAALFLATTAVVVGAVAFLRTDFVASNLCGYAIATIEEATHASVKVASCLVDPVKGTLVIDGLKIGEKGAPLQLSAARVFAQVEVRPLQQKLRLNQLEVDHADLRLAIEGGGAKKKQPDSGACLPEVLDRFELGRVRVRKASVDVQVKDAGVHVSVPRASVSVRGQGDKLKLALAAGAGTVSLPGRTVGLLSLRTDASVDLRGTGTLEVSRSDVIGTEATAYIKGTLTDLCNPKIEATANVHVDDLESATARLIPGVLRGVKGALQLDGLVRATAAGKLDAKGDLRIKALELEGLSPGNATAKFQITEQRITVSKLHVGIAKGEVNGHVELAIAEPGVPLSIEASLRDVELAELLQKLGIPRSHVVMKANGKLHAHGPAVPLSLRGEAALELADFAILDRRFEERDRASPALEFPRGHLTSNLAIDPEKVSLSKAVLQIGNSRLRIDGDLHTDTKIGLRLSGSADAVDLADFHGKNGGHIGPIAWRGKAGLQVEVVGPYEDVRIDAAARVADFDFMDLSLGEVAAKAHFERMVLSLTEIAGKKLQSGYAGDLRLDFGKDDMPVEAHLAISDNSHLYDLIDLAVGLVPTLSTVHDAADVDGLVSGTLHVRGPVARPDGYAQLSFADVNLWGQKFARGETQMALYKGVNLQIQKLELLHTAAKDSPALELSGSFGPEWKLQMDARTREFDLADLDSASAAQLHGPMLASAKIRGVSSHPLIDAELKFWGGKAGKAELGEGDFGMRIDGKALVSHGTVGPHVFDALARLEGDFGFTSTLAIRFDDLSGLFATFAPASGLTRGAASADVTAAGSLLKWREATGTVNLTKLSVHWDDAEKRAALDLANDRNGQLSFGPEGVDIKHFSLTDANGLVEAAVKGTRSRAGELDLRASATLDGKLLPAFTQAEGGPSENLIEHAAGTAYLEATIQGMQDDPVILGNLRIENGELRARNSPVAVRELNGRVSFSQKAVLVEDVTARLNAGPARFSGSIRLKDYAPEYLDLSARLTDVTVKLQENLSCTLEEGSQLSLVGAPAEPTLSGMLIVGRMKYTEEVNIEKQLLDFTRRPPAPRALAKSDATVHFNVDVHLSRGVRIENNLARADLKGDFLVTGTSRRLGLLGSVNTVHGTASFRGNDFQIEQGVINFTDRQSIRPSFDLQAVSSVKDYKVRLHAFGTPQDPRVSLTSDPALSEADLAFLLTFGFVQQQIQLGNVSAADTGTAIALEALNRVTGFSDEVQRFIPKNPILRNPTFDVTSDFSVASNRVEPMARFHSQLLTEKLDLKILRGFSTGKGRGVVAYRLTDALTAQGQLDNEHIQTGTDFGVDLSLRWEGN